MHRSILRFQSKFATLSLCLFLVTLWLCLHGYHGITGDGQIYAFQAFARVQPQLATDLYLQNTSQDKFTLFSPLYAWCIAVFGLDDAARLLTLLFTSCFLLAAWSFAAAVVGRDAAWLAVAFLLIVAGDYGGSRVFRILDPFLTARLPAEALVLAALACYARGLKSLGAVLAFGGLFMHPLMALPGLLLIACLWLPIRTALLCAIGGVSATLAIALIAVELPTPSSLPVVIDATWLDVVRERSQFLFLRFWSLRDWAINALPVVSLGFTAVAVADERIRKLCAAAALVGATGLAVSFIGGSIGPIAILVQGQAWRWLWITVFVGAVLLPFTAIQVSRDEKCGALCALSIVSAWVLPGISGTSCMLLAWSLWMSRERIGSRLAAYLRFTSVALGAAIGMWILMKCWTIALHPATLAGRAQPGIAQLQDMLELRVPAAMFGALVWWGTRANRAALAPVVLSAMLAAVSALVLPAAFKQSKTLAAAADSDEFRDWEVTIPPASTVLVAPPRDVGAFVWFTLARPNYLSVDQSSGVVFSRATALEVRRRSEVLTPLMDPNWKILSALRAKPRVARMDGGGTRPLTPQNLVQVCADQKLGFVISPEKVGFDFSPHEHAGPWKDWNLYDCRKVRSVPVAK